MQAESGKLEQYYFVSGVNRIGATVMLPQIAAMSQTSNQKHAEQKKKQRIQPRTPAMQRHRSSAPLGLIRIPSGIAHTMASCCKAHHGQERFATLLKCFFYRTRMHQLLVGCWACEIACAMLTRSIPCHAAHVAGAETDQNWWWPTASAVVSMPKTRKGCAAAWYLTSLLMGSCRNVNCENICGRMSPKRTRA